MKSVDYYLNNIIEFIDKAAKNRKREVSYDKDEIKKHLKDLIDNNMEYLLTDSFLYYLVIVSLPIKIDITEELCDNLDRLKGDLVDLINELLWGYVFALSEYRFLNSKYSRVLGSPSEILVFREDFEREIKEVYDEYMKKMIDNDDIILGYRGTFQVIFFKLLSLAFYYQDINVFKERVKPYLEDPVKELDNMYFHEILYEGSYPERYPVLSVDYYKVTDYIINKGNTKKPIK